MTADNPKRRTAMWPCFWDRPVDATNDEAALTIIRNCLTRRNVMLSSMHGIRPGDRRTAGRMSRRYLLSASAKIAALAIAYEKRIGKLKEAEPGTALEIVTAAQVMSAWSAQGERAMAYPKLKRDGVTHRWIVVSGLFLFAIDRLATDVAVPSHPFLPTQFILKGGIPAFDRWLEKRLPTAEVIITVDIPSCFDNIKRSSVEHALLLPPQVVNRSLFEVMDRAIYHTDSLQGHKPDKGHNAKASSTKRGIPQGSALSQVASEAVLSKVLRAVADVHASVHVANHGDNLFFALGDATYASSVIDALTSAVAEHFGAEVSAELAGRIRKDTRERFQFCRREYRYRKGAMSKGLPVGYLEEFAATTAVKIEEAYRAKDEKKFTKIRNSILALLGQHGRKRAVAEECAELLIHLRHMSEGVG